MKIILLLPLFGLSIRAQASDNTTCPTPASSDSSQCLPQALKEYSEHLFLSGQFLCDYYKYKDDENIEKFRAALRPYILYLKCLGCKLDTLFGTGHTFEYFLGDNAKFVEMADIAIKVAQILGLDKEAAKYFCILIGRILESQCLKEAIGNTTAGFIEDLRDLYCKLQENKATNASSKLASLMEELVCTANENFNKTDGNSMENIMKPLNNDILKLVAEKLLVLTKQFPVVDKSLCIVTGGKSITEGITEGIK